MTTYLRSHKLLVILALAALVRLGVLVAFPGVFAFDQTGAVQGSEAYDTYAQNILATGTFGRTPDVPDAAIPPLYSYLLAGVYALLGRGALQVGLLHILLDSASIALLYQIGKRLMPKGEPVGLLAALFYTLYPYLIFQNLTVNDTPLFITLLYAFLLLMVMLRERPALGRGTWVLSALAGLVLGLSMLVRTLIPPLALLVAVWFLFRLTFRQTVLRLLPVALLGVLIVLPWTLRNYGVYG
ncbi:MAG: glycosyltransferase family 39 protein, partial [Anaerolineae bacterium]|nr:glycosyltransferase family 39 protein [Anaerolineae bacterium]